MERDTRLRLVGAKGPATVSRAPLPSQSGQPAEHLSPEAMLKWAREQRSQVNVGKPESTRKHDRNSDKVSLAFAAPSADPVKVTVAEPAVAAPGRTGFWVVGMAVVTAAGALWAVYSQYGATVVGATDAPLAFAENLVEPALFGLPLEHDAGKLARLEPLRRYGSMALIGPALAIDPALAPEQPGRVQLTLLEAGGFLVSAGPLTLPLPTDFAAPARVAPPRGLTESAAAETRFVQPQQFSRQDLGQGAAALLQLLGGGAPVLAEVETAQPVAAPLSKPLIYIHHGLGVSPETVRSVMQQLSNAGYERVFLVGVPFRVGRTNIRFFHGADAVLAKSVAETVIAVVDGPQFTEPRDFTAQPKPPLPGTIDVWLSDKA